MQKTKILFLCVANSARSQIALGLSRQFYSEFGEFESAGSQPTSLHPLAAQVLQEIGFDPSGLHSKGIEAIPESFLKNVHTVISLCSEEVCPTILTTARRLHWPLPDPAKAPVDIENFRKIRDEIQSRLADFFKK